MKKVLFVLMMLPLTVAAWAPAAPVTKENCTCKGKKLWGKVKFVDAFEDIKVSVVDAFPDYKVRIVDAHPDRCGLWEIVTDFPDLRVRLVDDFPDLRVQYVDYYP
jgi:hypothetical protein